MQYCIETRNISLVLDIHIKPTSYVPNNSNLHASISTSNFSNVSHIMIDNEEFEFRGKLKSQINSPNLNNNFQSLIIRNINVYYNIINICKIKLNHKMCMYENYRNL